ncbi:MAG: PLP-dependent aminotransferase family protein [Paracoccaceae bacterium]
MEPARLTSLIDLNRARPEPLAVQLYRDLLAAILAGRAQGSLPSSRVTAAALGLSRNTVNAAYDLLRAEGAVAIAPCQAPRILPVGSGAPPPPTANSTGLPGLHARGLVWGADARTNHGRMAPGQPDMALFPRDAWAMTLRRTARNIRPADLAYDHYAGLPRLREVLARRLAADRGMDLRPDQILVTAGSQAALALLALTLAGPGDPVLVEDPGYGGAKAAFSGAGLVSLPIPVDGEGADCRNAPPARLVYLTPANQYPLGHRLSLARREAILAYARQHEAVLIEDDYDSEFLWHGREIAALQGRAPERVVTIGTVAKALAPALRLGWIVAPPHLAEGLRAAQRNLGLAANHHAQAALADFMDQGGYRAHLHRIARTYGDRGRAFAAALRRLPGIELQDPSGGVQLTISLPEAAEAPALAALRRAGFGCQPLSGFCLGPPRFGLVGGFADATPGRIDDFCAVLGQVLNARTGP